MSSTARLILAILAAAVVAYFVSYFTASLAQGDPNELRVGTECTYPPYSSRTETGEIVGFDIDVVNEVARRTELKPVFVCTVWEDIIKDLLADKYDIIASSMAITEERKKIITFSNHYMSFHIRFVALAFSGFDKLVTTTPDGLLEPKSLVGLSIGVQRATTHDAMITARLPIATIVRYDSTSALHEGLDNREADLIVVDTFEGDANYFQGDAKGKYEWIGKPITDPMLGDGVGFGMKYGNDPLRQKLNGALGAMKTDGTLRKLLLKTFPNAADAG